MFLIVRQIITLFYPEEKQPQVSESLAFFFNIIYNVTLILLPSLLVSPSYYCFSKAEAAVELCEHGVGLEEAASS